MGGGRGGTSFGSGGRGGIRGSGGGPGPRSDRGSMGGRGGMSGPRRWTFVISPLVLTEGMQFWQHTKT